MTAQLRLRFSSRASFSSMASRMKAAMRFGPAMATIRSNTLTGRRTAVVLVSESRLSGGRPMRGGVTVKEKFVKGHLFPSTLIDTISDDAYSVYIERRRHQMLNATDLQTYTAAQVASLADVDSYTVRNEGFRRQTAAEKKIDRLRKQLAAAEREMAEAAIIINAAFAEERRAA